MFKFRSRRAGRLLNIVPQRPEILQSRYHILLIIPANPLGIREGRGEGGGIHESHDRELQGDREPQA